MVQPAQPLLLLDAGPLLNLVAPQRLRPIVAALERPVGVADYVLSHEALYVWRVTPTGREREAIDLNPLVADGVITIHTLATDEELATFVSLAALMDDGEAITGALAIHRHAAVATDDAKARRVLRQHAPQVPLVSTMEIVKQWTERTGALPDEVRATLINVAQGATFYPGRRDLLYEWWRGFIGP